MKAFTVALTTFTTLFGLINGHGRMISPASRATMWRLGYENEPDYNDNQGFCGGFAEQYNDVNKGRCGICGDEWSSTREHEAPGGIYASTGIVTGSYPVGDWINVEIEITANHDGYFTFKLCPTNNWDQDDEQDCFDHHLLEMNYEGMEDGLAMPTPGENGVYSVQVKLPEDLECEQCVFQWTYTAGNSWGVGGICGEGVDGIGCGDQETFRACADIKIGGSDISNTTVTPIEEETTTENVETDAEQNCYCTCE